MLTLDELLEKADDCFDRGDLETAKEYYLRVLESEPNHVYANSSLGVLYHGLQDYEKALDYSGKALEYSASPQNCFNVALAYDMLNDHESAILFYSEAISRDPSYGKALYARGNLFFYSKKYSKAIIDYQAAAENSSEYLNLWFKWGEALFEEGYYEQALEKYQIYLKGLSDEEFADKSDLLNYRIALLHYYCGHFEDAKKIFENRLNPDKIHVESFVFLAAIANRTGKDEEEAKYLEQVKEKMQCEDVKENARLIKCPDCNVLFFLPEVSTTFPKETLMWSDKCPYPFGNKTVSPIVEYCPRCRKFFWVEDGEILFHLSPNIHISSIKTLNYDLWEKIELYQKILEQKWNPEQEKQIRIRFLWRLNHAFRNDPPGSVTFDEIRFDNLNLLAKLLNDSQDRLKHKSDNLWLAEVYREMGNFEQSISILDSLFDLEKIDLKKRKKIILLKEAALGKIQAPVVISDRPKCRVPFLGVTFPYEECIQNGFDLLPVGEDVFAFSTTDKFKNYYPILSFRLSHINQDWKGWGTYTYGAETWIHRYDRLFLEDEWEMLQQFNENLKEDLIWFWSFKSWNLPSNDLDRYYRIKYYLKRFDCNHEILFEKIKNDRNNFDKHWNEFIADQKNWESNVQKWFRQNQHCIYWKYFTSENLEISHTSIFEIKDLFEQEKLRREQLRRKAVTGLEYLEMAGEPHWFQGHDMTPHAKDGHKFEFLGQIWSDYLISTSKLLYLFYDPEDNILIEKYDYD